MKKGWGIKVLYGLFTMYTVSVLVDIVQLTSVITTIKGIEDAYLLLDLNWFWVIRVVSAVMADARDGLSFLGVLMGVISPTYILFVVFVLYTFWKTNRFKDIVAMLVVPYSLYALVLSPLIYGLITQEINLTFKMMTTVSWLVKGSSLCFIAFIIFKIALIGCGILELKESFNYNGLERGDLDVRNNE